MNAPDHLQGLGQSLWLDNISRGLLTSGTLQRYCRDLSITGLTSNPTIFDHAIQGSDCYDATIHDQAAAGTSAEAIFIELALQDLTRAADLFRPVHETSGGLDGWVSLEVSPLLIDDATATLREVKQLFARAQQPNLFIKIPGTATGLIAIEEAIFAGIPINVTLLFSRYQYLAAAEAYLRGIERRVEARLDPKVGSVASLFVSRWDVAVADNQSVPNELRNQLGIAMAGRTYRVYRELLASPRWRKLAEAGAMPQRLLWASTGVKNPQPGVRDTLYVESLAAPNTIITIPEATLLAFAEHGIVNGSMAADGGDAEKILAEFERIGVDETALAMQLQRAGAEAFSQSWHALLNAIETKSAALLR
jgi:transaldolase